MDELELLDWKRRVFALYAEIRAAGGDAAAWRRWRDTRDELFRSHPQSPLLPEARAGFAGLPTFDHDPTLRVLADVEAGDGELREIGASGEGAVAFRRFGQARFELAGEPQALSLYWLEAYGGGVFLPFADTTSGRRDLRRRAVPAGHGQGSRSRSGKTDSSSSTSTSPTTPRARTTRAGSAR